MKGFIIRRRDTVSANRERVCFGTKISAYNVFTLNTLTLGTRNASNALTTRYLDSSQVSANTVQYKNLTSTVSIANNVRRINTGMISK